MLERILDSAIAAATGACAGYLVGCPAIAAVGLATGGIAGALALLTSSGCIAFAMLVGSVVLGGFFMPPDRPPAQWVSVCK